MSQNFDSVAYSGGPPGPLPRTNIFDFIFGNPFNSTGSHVPSSQRLAPIDQAQPIFVDNKTSKSAKALFDVVLGGG